MLLPKLFRQNVTIRFGSNRFGSVGPGGAGPGALQLVSELCSKLGPEEHVTTYHQQTTRRKQVDRGLEMIALRSKERFRLICDRVTIGERKDMDLGSADTAF